MKNILITGKNSYVGTRLNEWLLKYPEKYTINSISVRGESWKAEDFSTFHSLVHVAGIAHIRETKENSALYYKVNRDLAYDIALKAKNEGVNHFIFLSSMSVYGLDSGIITKDTPLNPKSNYGKSKLQAEELITGLADSSFKVSVIRPPMIYGEECKGNYSKLASFVVKIPIFPDIENKRSMIYIWNLCEFLRLIIDDCGPGLFFPQNDEYMCTSKMAKIICDINGKKIIMTRLFNFILCSIKLGTINKVFGNLVYMKELSEYECNYCPYTLEDSIFLTEKGK